MSPKQSLLPVFILFLIAAIDIAGAQTNSELDLFKPIPDNRTEFEKSLDRPAPAPVTPNALEALERGKIPTDKNPLPEREGFSPQINPPGLQYRKSFP